MKSLIIFLTTFFYFYLSVNAQTPAQGWSKKIGGDSTDQSSSIAVDKLGNVVTAGRFYGTVDFDPGSGEAMVSGEGAFISKLNTDGQFVWAKSLGQCHIYSIAVDDIGNIYGTGVFKGTVDFDPGNGVATLTSEKYTNSFIIKLSNTGDFLWVKQLVNEDRDVSDICYNETYSMTVDRSGNIFATGYFRGAVDFDPGVNSIMKDDNGFGDMFVLKLNTQGELVWVKQMDGNSVNRVTSISLDQDGSIYTSGMFTGTRGTEYYEGYVDFDPGSGQQFILAPMGTNQGVFLKLDSLGNFVWVKQLQSVYPTSIATDTKGNVYSAGNFLGSRDFDPGPGNLDLTSSGAEDMFILKLTTSGTLSWAKQIGGIYTDYARSIIVDAQDNIYLGGDFTYTVDFNAGDKLMADGIPNTFIAKYSSEGRFQWVEHMAKGDALKRFSSMAVDSQGNVYATGSFEGTPHFAPDIENNTMTATGDKDVFIQKIQQNPVSVNEIIAGEYDPVFPNPTSGSITVKNSFLHSLESSIKMKIYTVTGMKINGYNIPFEDTITIDLSMYPTGLYTIILTAGSQSRAINIRVIR